MGHCGVLQRLQQEVMSEVSRCNYRSTAACDGADQPYRPSFRAK